MTNCHQLKMEAADGKKYLTDAANPETLLRLIQSVPSPKADQSNGWIFVDNVVNAEVKKEQNSIVEVKRDIKEIGNTETIVVAVIKDLIGKQEFRGNGEVYLLNDEGKTIERIN